MTGDNQTPRPKPELPPNHIEVGSGGLIEVTSFRKVVRSSGPPQRVDVPINQLYTIGASLAGLPLHIGTKETGRTEPTRPVYRAGILMNSRVVSPEASEREIQSQALIFRFEKGIAGGFNFDNLEKITKEEKEERGTGTLTIYHMKLDEPFVVDGEEIWEIIFVVPPEEEKK